MKCTILVSQGSPLSTVIGPYEMFQLANSLVEKERRIEINVVGTQCWLQEAKNFEFKLVKTFNEVERSDYIVIAPLGRITPNSLVFEQALLDWLQGQYQEGSRLISLCTGAFLLASTGLLDGKSATTHWQYDNEFQQAYPKVLLKSNEVICQQGRLLTSGGANAYQDLILHIIGEQFGQAVRRQCAKLLMLDFSRKNLQVFRTPDKMRRHLDEDIHILQDWLQETLAQPFKLDQLAQKINLSDRQVKRKFVKATGMPPLIYVQYMRVELAKEYLLETIWNVEKISDAVGYQDVRFFRGLFKRHVGVSPSQYRQNFT